MTQKRDRGGRDGGLAGAKEGVRACTLAHELIWSARAAREATAALLHATQLTCMHTQHTQRLTRMHTQHTQQLTHAHTTHAAAHAHAHTTHAAAHSDPEVEGRVGAACKSPRG